MFCRVHLDQLKYPAPRTVSKLVDQVTLNSIPYRPLQTDAIAPGFCFLISSFSGAHWRKHFRLDRLTDILWYLHIGPRELDHLHALHIRFTLRFSLRLQGPLEMLNNPCISIHVMNM